MRLMLFLELFHFVGLFLLYFLLYFLLRLFPLTPLCLLLFPPIYFVD